MYFNLYKGLQKPLTFHGFKGRYIYWGIGILVVALIGTVVNFIVFGGFIGVATLIFILGLGFSYTLYKQKKGLAEKKKDKNTLYIIRKTIKYTKQKI